MLLISSAIFSGEVIIPLLIAFLRSFSLFSCSPNLAIEVRYKTIISATKKNFDPYICYTIGQILYTFLPSLYVLSIVYNKERWRLLILAMTCKDEREKIYETSSIF